MPSLGQRWGSIKSWISYFWTIVELKKAEAKCTEYKNADGHDGHLVSIHTDEEANFVSSLIRGDGDEQVYWIGLRMNCPTCEFEWTDQSSFNYANWQDGEPNNSEGKGFSERKIVQKCSLYPVKVLKIAFTSITTRTMYGMIKSVPGVWDTFANIMCPDRHCNHHNHQQTVHVQMINGSNTPEFVTMQVTKIKQSIQLLRFS